MISISSVVMGPGEPVILQGQFADHLVGVFGRAVHGGHAGAVLGATDSSMALKICTSMFLGRISARIRQPMARRCTPPGLVGQGLHLRSTAEAGWKGDILGHTVRKALKSRMTVSYSSDR